MVQLQMSSLGPFVDDMSASLAELSVSELLGVAASLSKGGRNVRLLISTSASALSAERGDNGVSVGRPDDNLGGKALLRERLLANAVRVVSVGRGAVRVSAIGSMGIRSCITSTAAVLMRADAGLDETIVLVTTAGTRAAGTCSWCSSGLKSIGTGTESWPVCLGTLLWPNNLLKPFPIDLAMDIISRPSHEARWSYIHTRARSTVQKIFIVSSARTSAAVDPTT